jgi:hypothetical protein
VLPADTVLREEIKDSVDRFYDGASLFFFARTILHRDTSLTIPTLVEFDMFTTDLTITVQRLVQQRLCGGTPTRGNEHHARHRQC